MLEKTFEAFELKDKLNSKISKDFYDLIKILHAQTKIDVPRIEYFLFNKIYDSVFNQDEDT